MTWLRRPAWSQSLIQHARDGSWLTSDRMTAYAGIAVGIYACVLIYMLYVGVHVTRDTRPPVAGDFGQVWAAGHAVLQGHPLAPYDLKAHSANMHALFGAKAPLYVWVYPPFCLAVAALLAMMPYLVAVMVEQALMLGLYLKSIHAILPQRAALLCAVAMPSVVINLGYGQIGTLTAGLSGMAAACLDRRPAVAGVLFACMAYKPQLGLAIPVALLAGRCWTTIAAGTAAATVLCIASTTAFGWHSWVVFFASLHTAGDFVFAKGAVDWFKFQSVFAAARMWGAGPTLAWGVQGLAVLLTLSSVAWVWWQDIDTRLKMALLLVASLLCTPYCFEYDLVVLSPAIALVVSHGCDRGFLDWQKTLLAVFGAVPLVEGLAANYLRIPLGLASIVGFAVLIVRRAATDLAPSAQPSVQLPGYSSEAGIS